MLALLIIKILTLCTWCCTKFSGGELLILSSFARVLRILAGKTALLGG